ncbi:putative Ig domain-containing protein [Streptomyces sp. NPDC048551]|uniref:putative Ig domain-containing protein n=1 Tax=Streptomyces sp. NPDC048551 TaxID=3155758 RepID=UPI0034223DB0
MRSSVNRPALTGLVAFAALATLAVPAARAGGPSPSAPAAPAATATATAPQARVPQDVQDAMGRDLGLSAAQVRDRIDRETEAARAATAVRATVGDRIAGLWFDASDGRLHVAVTGAAGSAEAAAVRAAGAVPHQARSSRARLEETAATVGRWASGVPGVVSWGPDARADGVEVTVDPGRSTAATTAFRARLAALADLVRVVESRDVPRQQGGSVIGGEKWIPGSESPCSIGFPVTRTTGGGGKAFLTAGHCTNDADQPAYGKDGSRVGTSNRGGVGSVNAREGDMGIVDVDQPAWSLAPTVAGWGKGDVTVTGSAEAVVGTAVCHSGQTTGLQCGEVTKVDQSVDYGTVVIDGLSYSSACSAGGDSGGSYVTAAGGKAVGLHSGGGSATCTGGSGEKFTIFQPVNEALTRFGASLVTSAPQPDAVTVAAVSAQSGVTGTPVELKNSAEGGTAPYTWTATGLPAGLAVASATGTVSGTPTTAGTSSVTLTATDAAGRRGSTTFSWTVTLPGTGSGPALSDPGSQSAYIGRPYRLQLQATGGTKPYAFGATGLPVGLTVDKSTGVVSGTATAWGFRNATLTVTDASGRKSTVTTTFTVWS